MGQRESVSIPLKCWWCAGPCPTSPIRVPIGGSFTEGSLRFRGQYCSVPCAKGHVLQQGNGFQMGLLATWLKQACKLPILEFHCIRPNPSRLLLQEFGGPLLREEWSSGNCEAPMANEGLDSVQPGCLCCCPSLSKIQRPGGRGAATAAPKVAKTDRKRFPKRQAKMLREKAIQGDANAIEKLNNITEAQAPPPQSWLDRRWMENRKIKTLDSFLKK